MARQAQQPEAEAAAFAPPAVAPKHDDALPLPGWLTKVYYVFPVVLYVPDMIFNFFVYSDGSGVDFNSITILTIPQLALWGFLSAGIVGMAWLLSVLAPWHWARGNYFQSLMCWFGVVLATAITMWNSLAYRSQKFHAFKTDSLFGTTNLSSFSLTMIIVALAPPFWGLFWAIVQPAQPKRSAEAERESHQQRLERLKQESEIKRAKAEANAQIRAAQITGFAATARAARAQIGAAVANNAATTVDGSVTVTPETNEPISGERVVALPAGSIRRLSERRTGWGTEESESGEHEIIRGAAAASMSYSVAAQTRDDVFEAPDGSGVRATQSMLPMDRPSGEHETLLSTSRPGMPRASTLLRNYAEGEHVMRAVDGDVEQMRLQGMKVTIKSFAEYRGIELSLAKQLLAKWREWKSAQQQSELAAGE